MEIIFDPDKGARNVAKHGVSLGDAASLNWRSVLASADRRRDYGEQREVGFGLIGERLFCVVFVQQSNAHRIISLRKANSREVKRYAQQIG